MKLMVEKDATPVAHHTPVPVPLHWQEQVKADIDRDVSLGVLEPVPVGEPVTWCHRMVVCAKKNGKPRRTVDFQPLNKFATRETHHTQSPFLQARAVPHGMKKTVFDAWNGYHSVPIREEEYRNCPDKDTKLSPAQCLFSRPIRDFIPILPGRYHPHNTWRETLKAREEALRNRHMRAAERWSEHTKRLPPLVVGDKVRVQNQTGPHPTKWDKTGTITEVRQYDQYIVKMDGSSRMTIRNRKFLRKYIPVMKSAPIITSTETNYQNLNKTQTTQPPLLDEGEPLPPAPLPTPLTLDFMPAQVPVELMAPPPLGETTQTPPMVPNLETPPIISDQKTPPLLPDPDGIPSTSNTPRVKDQTRHPLSPVRPVPLRRSTRELRSPKRYTDHDYQMAIQLPPNN